MDPLVSDYLYFDVFDVKVLVIDTIIKKENSIPIELQGVQDTLNIIANEKTLDHFTIRFSEITAIVLYWIQV